jgi:hypothetical protein
MTKSLIHNQRSRIGLNQGLGHQTGTEDFSVTFGCLMHPFATPNFGKSVIRRGLFATL